MNSRQIYSRLANSVGYKTTDGRLKAITWIVASLSGLSTAISNGWSHRAVIGPLGAALLGLLTFGIVEGALYTVEDGLRNTFKGGTQRAVAWCTKWLIKGTMILNAAYLCTWITGIPVPNNLLLWNKWCFAVHFAVGLILVPMIRDADPVIAHTMLQLKTETAQQDQIIARLAAAIGSPFAMAGARIRGVLDGLGLGWKLSRNHQGFSTANYVANLNALARAEYEFAEGARQLPSGPASLPNPVLIATPSSRGPQRGN